MAEREYPTAVVSFRVLEYEKHLIRAAALRRGVDVAAFVREATLAALRSELLAADEERVVG